MQYGLKDDTMLMTQTEMNKFLHQINEAFKGQFDKVEVLETKIETLEAQMASLQAKSSKSGKNNNK